MNTDEHVTELFELDAEELEGKMALDVEEIEARYARTEARPSTTSRCNSRP